MPPVTDKLAHDIVKELLEMRRLGAWWTIPVENREEAEQVQKRLTAYLNSIPGAPPTNFPPQSYAYPTDKENQ